MNLNSTTNAGTPPNGKAPDILYDGKRLLIKGTDVSDICTELQAEVRGGEPNKVTVTFTNVNVVIQKTPTWK